MSFPLRRTHEFEKVWEIERRFGLKLPNIHRTHEFSQQIHSRLAAVLEQATPTNCGLIVYGSVARGEMTHSSDVDWTLLVDGAADTKHQEEAVAIERGISDLSAELKFKRPNPEGAFGRMCFSHELVHAIGGERDSNSNMTRRVLLLLESRAIANSLVRDRVVRNILTRYLEPKHFGYLHRNQRDYFPRFLMNDVVRFWRTMTVDYACKRAERGDKEWALRSTKLRFSRKMIFASGMLISYQVALGMPQPPPDLCESGPFLELLTRAQGMTQLPPLEVVAQSLLDFGDGWPGQAEAARDIFESYDTFLGMLDDSDRRNKLADLKPAAGADDETFNEVRRLSQQFQHGLDSYFFDGPHAIRMLTRKYALF